MGEVHLDLFEWGGGLYAYEYVSFNGQSMLVETDNNNWNCTDPG